MRYESLGSTHQGACKCLEKQKKVSSRTEMESAARVLQNECPYSAARELFLSRDSVGRGHNPILSPRKTQTFPAPRRMWGESVSLLQVHCPVFSLCSPPQLVGGRGYLTNRFESCNLLKMLMSKRRAPGSIKMLT